MFMSTLGESFIEHTVQQYFLRKTHVYRAAPHMQHWATVVAMQHFAKENAVNGLLG